MSCVIELPEEVYKELPRSYTPALYEQKCDRVYQHIYDSYADAAHSIYTAA